MKNLQKNTNWMNRPTVKFTTSLIAATFLTFCGENSATNPDAKDPTGTVNGVGGTGSQTTIDSDQPADSTGAFGTVSLAFSRGSTTALALTAEAAGMDLGNGIVISDARVNIAAIKLKSDKEPSEAEESLRDAMKLKKKEWEKEIEARKDALELEVEDLKSGFETSKEGLGDVGEAELKDAFKTDEGKIKERMALLEKEKDDQESDYEMEHDKNIKWKGPYVYNLVDGTISPELPDAEVVDGSYKRIEFKLKKNTVLPGTDLLLGNSIVVQGTVLVNDVATSFIARFHNSMKFRLMGAGAFKVDDVEANPLNIAFQSSSWFTGVDLTTATADAAGTILVDEINNKALWVAMRKNIKSSTRFGKDEDGDGELEDGESEGDGEEGLEAVETEDSEDEEAEEDESSEDDDEETEA